MRKVILVLLLSLFVLSGCVNTSSFSSPLMQRGDLSFDEKMKAIGKDAIQVDVPEAIQSGEEWLERLMELISESEDYIMIVTFLGTSSPVLEPLYDLLIAKAESGVDVYMVIDGSSSFDMTESKKYLTPLSFLEKHGIHLVEYNPIALMNAIAPKELLKREHRKIFIFDGKKAAIGGMNLNYISLGAGDLSQRDSMYLFSSKNLSRTLAEIFVNLWNSASVEKISADDFAFYSEDVTQTVDAYLFNQGPESKDRLPDLYSALINSAEHEIRLFAHFPLLDENMKDALKRAKERGVYIEIIANVEERAVSGVSYDLPSLVDAVTDLFIVTLESGPTVHEKLVVVDGTYSLIGSTNFNYRSMGLSNEIAMVLESEDFALYALERMERIKSEGVYYVDKQMAERMKEENSSFLAYLITYYGG